MRGGPLSRWPSSTNVKVSGKAIKNSGTFNTSMLRDISFRCQDSSSLMWKDPIRGHVLRDDEVGKEEMKR